MNKLNDVAYLILLIFEKCLKELEFIKKKIRGRQERGKVRSHRNVEFFSEKGYLKIQQRYFVTCFSVWHVLRGRFSLLTKCVFRSLQHMLPFLCEKSVRIVSFKRFFNFTWRIVVYRVKKNLFQKKIEILNHPVVLGVFLESKHG